MFEAFYMEKAFLYRRILRVFVVVLFCLLSIFVLKKRDCQSCGVQCLSCLSKCWRNSCLTQNNIAKCSVFRNVEETPA